MTCVLCFECRRPFKELKFEVSWGDFCSANCASRFRHRQLGELDESQPWEPDPAPGMPVERPGQLALPML